MSSWKREKRGTTAVRPPRMMKPKKNKKKKLLDLKWPRVHGEVTDTQTFKKKIESTKATSSPTFIREVQSWQSFLVAKWSKRETLEQRTLQPVRFFGQDRLPQRFTSEWGLFLTHYSYHYRVLFDSQVTTCLPEHVSLLYTLSRHGLHPVIKRFKYDCLHVTLFCFHSKLQRWATSQTTTLNVRHL